MENNSFLNVLTVEKIEFGENLLKSIEQYYNIDGINKLERKIIQEINFLKKILRNNSIKKEHLQCTNLTHFSALIDVIATSNECISVNKIFALGDKRLNIDIVCDNGLSWTKVIARNPKSISQISMGDTGYGVRSILDHAEEFLECSKLYPCLFKTPKVIFYFANGIENMLAIKLEALGILVKGNRLNKAIDLNDKSVMESKSVCEGDKNCTSDIEKINLDVSAIIAYVSSLTNGNCNFVFKVPVLTQQAKWERLRPVKPVLDKLFEGKKLFCCETAKVNFDMIVNTVGGPNERIRAKEFFRNITVLPDNATISDAEQKSNEPVQNICENEEEQKIQFTPNSVLPLGGKIKERSKIIFRFGDRIQAITVTANDGFIRSAKQQGINFVVFVHESRALTEQKEQNAEKISAE